MPDVFIRQASPEDAHAITKLCRAHAEFEQSEVVWSGHEQRLHAVLQQANNHLKIFLAQSGDEALGYASITIDFATWTAKHFLHMDCLFIKEEHRNKGIGHLLMSHIAEYGKRTGITEIQWQTPEWNTQAAGFYENLGATQKPKRRFFWNV
jgi:ribosomal protein S18 acetylase RimI-like enzyme